MDELIKALACRAEAELKENSRKGDFDTWNPSPEELVSEIHHHADKLLVAMQAKDEDATKEHLADILNYLKKGWEQVER